MEPTNSKSPVLGFLKDHWIAIGIIVILLIAGIALWPKIKSMAGMGEDLPTGGENNPSLDPTTGKPNPSIRPDRKPGDLTLGLNIIPTELHTVDTTNSGTNAVELFVDTNYQGHSVKMPVGDFNIDKLNEVGFFNDTVSSLKVPMWYQITLYENKDFSGKNITFNHDVPDLRKYEFYPDDNNKLKVANWNDKASSFKVSKTN